MTVPIFVQASAGQTIATGTATHSLAGTTAGNLVCLHMLEKGTVVDFSAANWTNTLKFDGTASTIDNIIAGDGFPGTPTGTQTVWAGRVAANGTISVDMTVGASGDDLFLRWYEFSGATPITGTGITVGNVFENVQGTGGAGNVISDAANTNTGVGDAAVQTKGSDRLALNFIAINASQVTTVYTGQTGGTWVRPIVEYIGGGAVMTSALQIASMQIVGTIDGGTFTIASAAWGTMGTAIIPAVLGGPGDNPPVGFSGRGAGW